MGLGAPQKWLCVTVMCLLVTQLPPLQKASAAGDLSIEWGDWDGFLRVDLSRGDIASDHQSQDSTPERRVITHSFTIRVTSLLSGKDVTLSYKATGPNTEQWYGSPTVKFEPARGGLPLISSVTITIERYLDIGNYNLEIIADCAADGTRASRSIRMSLVRDELQIVLMKPESGQVISPVSGVFAHGYVTPRVPGVLVNIDVYHKYPEFDTEEKLSGTGSGIRARGTTFTDEDGSFAVSFDDSIFTNGLVKGNVTRFIEAGRFWILYYSNGLKLYGEELAEARRNDLSKMRGGIKTWEKISYILTPTLQAKDNVPNPNQLVNFNLQGETVRCTGRFCITLPEYVGNIELESGAFTLRDGQPDETPEPKAVKWMFSATIEGKQRQIGDLTYPYSPGSKLHPQHSLQLGRSQGKISQEGASEPKQSETIQFDRFREWSDLVRQYGGQDEDFLKSNSQARSLKSDAKRVLKINVRADILDDKGKVFDSSTTESFNFVLRPPVIFIHGTAGSFLLVNGREAWPRGLDEDVSRIVRWALPENPGRITDLFNVSNPQVTVGGLIETVAVPKYGDTEVYAPFIRFMKSLGYDSEETGFYKFVYDWRKDNRDHVKPLHDLVDKVKKDHPYDRIIILAHSNGGLVARYYASQYKDFADNIEAFVFMGTPHKGAPRGYQAIALEGYNFGNTFMSSTTGKKLAANLPAAYILLPTYPFITDKTKPDAVQQITVEQAYLNHPKLASLVSNKELLNKAIEFHKTIGSQAPPGVPSINIAGVNIAGTLTGVEVEFKEPGLWNAYSARTDFTKIENQLGDKTVPLASARGLEGDNVAQFLVQAVHGNIPNNAHTQRLLEQVLKGVIPPPGQTEIVVNDIALKLNSHSSLHVYDEENRHVGTNEWGLVDEQIPGSGFEYFEESQCIYLPASGQYTVKVSGESKGTFTLETEVLAGGKYTRSTYSDVPIDNGVNATLIISGGEPSPTMKMSGGESVAPHVESANMPSKIQIEPSIEPSTIAPSQTSPILYPLATGTHGIQNTAAELVAVFSKPVNLLFPSAIWLAVALPLGLVLRSGKKSILITVATSVFIAYYVANWSPDLISLGVNTTLILPGIAVGAFAGGVIGRRLTKKTKPSGIKV